MRYNADIKPIGGEGEKVGFVFPSYYGNLPRIVRSFVENLEIKSGAYIFTVVTMGGFGQGSIAALESLLKKKGLLLDYGRGILAPANYIIMYNPMEKRKVKLNKVDLKIRQISTEIAAGKKSVKAFKFTANNLYRNIESLDEKFLTLDSCTGCGQCVKICPAGNITLEREKSGKPLICWLHKCERCVACISWCPAGAIQYGSITVDRNRYQNPEIKIEELIV